MPVGGLRGLGQVAQALPGEGDEVGVAEQHRRGRGQQAGDRDRDCGQQGQVTGQAGPVPQQPHGQVPGQRGAHQRHRDPV